MCWLFFRQCLTLVNRRCLGRGFSYSHWYWGKQEKLISNPESYNPVLKLYRGKLMARLTLAHHQVYRINKLYITKNKSLPTNKTFQCFTESLTPFPQAFTCCFMGSVSSLITLQFGVVQYWNITLIINSDDKPAMHIKGFFLTSLFSLIRYHNIQHTQYYYYYGLHLIPQLAKVS